MNLLKLDDKTRPYNEEFYMSRRIIYQVGDYKIKCVISFPDSCVEYTASIPNSLISVSASARKKEPLFFSINNLVCLGMNNKKELDKFIAEMNTIRQLYDIIEEIDNSYNTLRNIDGEWTKTSVEEVKAYV